MNQETPFASKRAPIYGSALMAQLIDDKIDLQKRLDAAIAALADQRDVSSREHEAWLKAMSKIGDLEAELDALKKQEPIGFISEECLDKLHDNVWQQLRNTPVNLWTINNPPSRARTPVYVAVGAAGAQPTREPLTKDQKYQMWVDATIELPSQQNCYLRGVDDAERLISGARLAAGAQP